MVSSLTNFLKNWYNLGMIAKELKEKYIRFFEERGHKLLPNVSLIPEDDSTTLFISAGMQPLVPYLLGQPHPLGKKLVSLQRCLRTADIENVGNVFHNTFFEMLGNWSLGDYWKKESLSWSLEFLTKVLGLDSKRLHVTVFRGDKSAPKDEESEKIWRSLGIPKRRIYFLPKEDNWWEAGASGPGGPDSEIFYDLGGPACGPNCRPGDNCGRFFEMWNNVFMEYDRKPDGTYEKLKQKNVDTGMGVERTSVVLQGVDNVFQTDVFAPIINKIEELSGHSYQEGKNQKPMRIIADHLRAAVFAIADGVVPSNKERGYVLRRLIRRAAFQMQQLSISALAHQSTQIGQEVMKIYGEFYPQLKPNLAALNIKIVISEEIDKFERTLFRGIKFLQKQAKLNGRVAFDVFQTYGLPFEVIQEIAGQKGKKIRRKEFEGELDKHQELSRLGAKQKFAGGLADQSEMVVRYHTATHLLQAALREILGDHIHQVGSNITDQRARFDFTYPKPVASQAIKKIEGLINQKIEENLLVTKKTVSFGEAKRQDALIVLGKTYPEKVSLYEIGRFSREVCGGPHVTKTGEIGRIKIVKEEGIGEGKRRVYIKFD